MDIEIGNDTFTKKPNILEEIAYRDTWGKGADSFIAMIYERLVLMRDLLAEDGSIYVHCDSRVNELIKLAMIEVFGTDNCVKWNLRGSDGYRPPAIFGKARKAYFGKICDTIFLFRKNEQQIVKHAV